LSVQNRPRVIYDFRVAPCTFDFAQFLSLAKCYVREKFSCESFDLWLYRPYFRAKGHIENHPRYRSQSESRFFNIVLAVVQEVNLIGTLHILKDDTKEDLPDFFDFPPGYQVSKANLNSGLSQMPCNLVFLERWRDSKFDPRIFSTTSKDDVRPLYDVTLSLRNSPQKPERASDLNFYFSLYEALIDKKLNVVVIPDYDDFMGERSYLKYNWRVFDWAAASLKRRLDVYNQSRLNVLSPAGWNVLCYLGVAPYIILGYLCRNDPICNLDFHKRKGPEPFQQLYWSGPSGWIDWSEHDDLSLEHVLPLISERLNEPTL